MIHAEQKALSHPVVSDFATCAEKHFNEGAFDFGILQKPEFLKFWGHLMIAKHLEPEDDFHIVLWGTQLATSYGKDLTGKKFSESGFGEMCSYFHTLHKKVMLGGELVFTSGSFTWEQKDYKHWYQVKMPLRRNGPVLETLSCFCFD